MAMLAQLLRQQFQRTAEHGAVEDALVQRSAVDGGGSGCAGAGDCRRVGFARQAVGLGLEAGVQRATEFGLQAGQKLPLARRLHAIGVADTHRQLVGQLAVFPRFQGGHGLAQAQALEQHVLHQRRDVQRACLGAQCGGDALDLLALGLGLFAVGKRRQQRYGEQGALFFTSHGPLLQGMRNEPGIVSPLFSEWPPRALAAIGQSRPRRNFRGRRSQRRRAD